MDKQTRSSIQYALDAANQSLEAARQHLRRAAEAARKNGSSEFARTFAGEIDSYIEPAIKEFQTNKEQPGSIASLREALREEP